MRVSHVVNRVVVALFFLPATTSAGPSAPGAVLSHQKISETEGGFTGILENTDVFGYALAALGDLDGDGVGDLAVGAPGEDGEGTPPDADRGAVWVLFLNPDGTVKAHQKISSTEGGFTGTLDDGDRFGISVCSLGDLDLDGVGDLAVGTDFDDDGTRASGAVWVLFLNSDGTVKRHQKISNTEGGFTGTLAVADRFGTSVAFLGDHDGDGVGDLAVGAVGDNDGNGGAVWVLFLNSDGTVKSHQKISVTQGGFTGTLDEFDLFGHSVAFLGDLDGDGVGDLAVGANWDDDGCTNPANCSRGAVWVLFLNSDGTVKAHQKISDTQGGFSGTLDNGDQFSRSLTSLGDLDGDGVGDLAVGAHRDDDGGTDRGAVWVLFLNPDGTVKSHQKISGAEGGFTGTLDDYDYFGTAVASLGDPGRDGVGDLAVGAPLDDDGGTPLAADRGGVWVLSLDGIPACPWDCSGDDDGVGIGDFLALLAQWGMIGASCDFGLGEPGVGREEFCELLANWGPCP